MRDRLILIAATFTLICSVPATAQTPDGLTPAVETVCDDLIGYTPGLYGLCVAYCEAHDADDLPELDVPNRNILRNYEMLRGDSGPEMPCLDLEPEVPQVTCPCWTADKLLTVMPPETKIDTNFLHACDNSPKQAVLENIDNGLTDIGKFKTPAIQLIAADTEAIYCRVIDSSYGGGPWTTPLEIINTDELQSCQALLPARALARTPLGDAWDCFDL